MSDREYKGSIKSVYVTMGARNGAKDADRQSEDFYATEPKAIHELCKVEKFSHIVLEPACGMGHMAEALKEHGYEVMASDIIDRGYPGTEVLDFFRTTKEYPCDIITNPPYKYAKEFVEHALKIVPKGQKVAMFLKLTFLESKARRKFFKKYPPKKVWVFSERVLCAKNGDFEALKKSAGGAVAYAWFIFEKGYQGPTELGWLGKDDD